VLTAAYAVGHISGGHFNPAVSLGAAAAGRMPWKDVLPYIAAQIVGGVLATLVLWLISATSGGKFTADFGAVSNGYGPLAVRVRTRRRHHHRDRDHCPVPVGHPRGHRPERPRHGRLRAAGDRSRAHAVPPGRDPGQQRLAQPRTLDRHRGLRRPDALGQLWVFLVAPPLGALIAGFTWKYLFARTARS
jgi:Glycerol uptake facilitator and related permeases (Major Intrinsic Protein Family)